MADALKIGVGDHMARVVNIRRETAATGSIGIVITFEDTIKRRAWRHCWLSAGALSRSLEILRTLGFEGEPDAAGFTKFLKNPPIDRQFRIRLAEKRDRPGEVEVIEVWSPTGISPEEADAAELAYAVEQARLGRKPRKEQASGFDDDECKLPPAAVPAPEPDNIMDPLLADL